jgi:hypothetical protein
MAVGTLLFGGPVGLTVSDLSPVLVLVGAASEEDTPEDALSEDEEMLELERIDEVAIDDEEMLDLERTDEVAIEDEETVKSAVAEEVGEFCVLVSRDDVLLETEDPLVGIEVVEDVSIEEGVARAADVVAALVEAASCVAEVDDVEILPLLSKKGEGVTDEVLTNVERVDEADGVVCVVGSSDKLEVFGGIMTAVVVPGFNGPKLSELENNSELVPAIEEASATDAEIEEPGRLSPLWGPTPARTEGVTDGVGASDVLLSTDVVEMVLLVNEFSSCLRLLGSRPPTSLGHDRRGTLLLC